ncbi:MAG: hypothetical protein KAS30_01765 [Candidatus Diapherotrites archaeon]|nr:hypothetical protein [Candidatus Diapherotrites archaeon]
MKEALLQIQHGSKDFIIADEDDDVLRNFKHNQKVRVKIQGVQKEGSWNQLKLWFAVCRYCSNYMGEQRLNTEKKMSKYVLIKTGHVDFSFPVGGVMHMEAVSMSYANMEQNIRNGVVQDGLELMCIDMMGSTVKKIINELIRQGKWRGEYTPEILTRKGE